MAEPITVVAFLKPAEGKKDEVKQGLDALIAKVQEGEDGVLRYQYYWDEKGQQFIFVELYKDMEAIANHRAQPYMVEMKAKAEEEGLLVGGVDARIITPMGGFVR